MSPRIPEPLPDDIVTRLGQEGQPHETEDVIALIGFVGHLRDSHLRLYPDEHLQRWMEVPLGEIVDSYAIDPEAEHHRTVIWVRREWMLEEMFEDTVFEALREQFTGAWMSTWPLIPDSRYIAARMLDLVAHDDEGTYP